MKTMSRLFIIPAVFLFISFQVKAQCPPPSSPYVHQVQKGESLWRIAKKYGITLDEIARLNSFRNLEQTIHVCDEIVVDNRYFSQGGATTTTATTASQQGHHVIQQGETIAEIARAYGYTEERFRRFNQLNQNERAWPGMVLKTSDCICPSLTEEPTYTGGTVPYDATRNVSKKGDGATTTSTPTAFEETGSRINTDIATTGWGDPISVERSRQGDPVNTEKVAFGEDPFGESEIRVSDYNQGQEDWFINQDQPPTKISKEVETKESPISSPPVDIDQLPADEQVLHRKRTNRGQAAAGTNPIITKDAARYMTAEEVAMVNEINLVRSNPKGYIKYIEEYKEKVRRGQAFGSVATCQELIDELKKTPALSVLQPTECIYQAAKKHGLDQRPTGSTDHVGTDGSYPWDRVKRECPNMTDGNENLVGGPSAVRDAVILLLVDDGIPNRGHRRTLLQKDWKYVACYKIGKVGSMPNCWVQKFGK